MTKSDVDVHVTAYQTHVCRCSSISSGEKQGWRIGL